MIAGASVSEGGVQDLLVLRIDATGALDPSYAKTGTFAFDSGVGPKIDCGYGLTLGPNDSVFIAGTSAVADSKQCMAVWQLDTSGALVTEFGGVSPSSTPGMFLACATHGGTDDAGWDVTLDGDGNLIVVGEAEGTTLQSAMAVWKIRRAP